MYVCILLYGVKKIYCKTAPGGLARRWRRLRFSGRVIYYRCRNTRSPPGKLFRIFQILLFFFTIYCFINVPRYLLQTSRPTYKVENRVPVLKSIDVSVENSSFFFWTIFPYSRDIIIDGFSRVGQKKKKKKLHTRNST